MTAMSTPTQAERRKIAEELSKKLVDQGKLIEAGFVALRIMVIPDDASSQQRSDMRVAFMAGAQHLFASIISIMEPGTEPTDNDMRRMGLISKELEQFGKDFEMQMKLRGAPKG